MDSNPKNRIDSLESELKGVLERCLLRHGYKETKSLMTRCTREAVRSLWKANPQGGAWTQQEIADHLGVSREWITKLLGKRERVQPSASHERHTEIALWQFLKVCPLFMSERQLEIVLTNELFLLPASIVSDQLHSALIELETQDLLDRRKNQRGEWEFALRWDISRHYLGVDVHSIPPAMHIDSLRHRIQAHLEFHAATIGLESAAGPRLRMAFRFDMMRSFGRTVRDTMMSMCGSVFALLERYSLTPSSFKPDEARMELTREMEQAIENLCMSIHEHQQKGGKRAETPIRVEVIVLGGASRD